MLEVMPVREDHGLNVKGKKAVLLLTRGSDARYACPGPEGVAED